MTNERILVTGGAGFIGSKLTRALAAYGHRLWVLDNLLPQVHGENAEFSKIDGDVAFCRGDVADSDTMRRIVAEARPQLVYHLAADTGTGQSFTEVSRCCRTNVMGTATLIDVLRAQAPELRRMVIASSRAVYGEGAYEGASGRIVVPPPRRESDMREGRFVPFHPEERGLRPVPTGEGVPCEPCSVYGSTKLAQEQIARQIALAAPWDVCVLRLQNVYGPGQSLHNPYTGVLSLFVRLLLAGRSIEVFEDGEITRDFVFVSDVVEALMLAGWAAPTDGRAINIGTGTGTTILEAALQLGRVVGRSPRAIRVTGAYRIGDIRHAIADTRHAAAVLGWRPKIDFPAGAAALVDWARPFAAGV